MAEGTAQIGLKHIQLAELIVLPQPLVIGLRLPQLPLQFILALSDPFLIEEVELPADLVPEFVLIEGAGEAAEEEVAEGDDAADDSEYLVELGSGDVVGVHLLGVGERNVEPEAGVGPVVVEPQPFLVVGLEAIGHLVLRARLPVAAVVVGDVGF